MQPSPFIMYSECQRNLIYIFRRCKKILSALSANKNVKFLRAFGAQANYDMNKSNESRGEKASNK